jgi:hypothetical protein
MYQTLNERKIHPHMSVLKLPLPSTESRRISSSHNLLSYNRYCRKYFKLVYRKYVVMVTLTTGIMFLLFTCMHFWVWGIFAKEVGSASAPTVCEVVRDCRKFEKHCSRPVVSKVGCAHPRGCTLFSMRAREENKPRKPSADIIYISGIQPFLFAYPQI